MNRQERRKMGISKEQADKMNHLNSNCTILEAVQLAQGVAEDAIKNYHESINPVIVSLSIQVEVLKDMLSSTGSLDMDKFKTMFEERVEDYNKQRDEAFKEFEKMNKVPKTDIKPMDLSVEKTN